MHHSTTQTSITGRDGYIELQALMYAIASIQSLPTERQEWSNMNDMCLLARARMQGILSAVGIALAVDVREHTGKSFTLWPEADEYLSLDEKKSRDAFERSVELMAEHRRDSFEKFLAEYPEYRGTRAQESGTA